MRQCHARDQGCHGRSQSVRDQHDAGPSFGKRSDVKDYRRGRGPVGHDGRGPGCKPHRRAGRQADDRHSHILPKGRDRGLERPDRGAPTVLRELTDETLDSLHSDLPAQGWADHSLGEIGMAVETCESDAPVRSRTVKTPAGPLILPTVNDAWARAPLNGFRRKYRNSPPALARRLGEDRPPDRRAAVTREASLRRGPDQMIRTWVPTGVMA